MLILCPEGFLKGERYSEISIIIFNFMINFRMTQFFKPDYIRKKNTLQKQSFLWLLKCIPFSFFLTLSFTFKKSTFMTLSWTLLLNILNSDFHVPSFLSPLCLQITPCISHTWKYATCMWSLYFMAEVFRQILAFIFSITLSFWWYTVWGGQFIELMSGLIRFVK